MSKRKQVVVTVVNDLSDLLKADPKLVEWLKKQWVEKVQREARSKRR